MIVSFSLQELGTVCLLCASYTFSSRCAVCLQSPAHRSFWLLLPVPKQVHQPQQDCCAQVQIRVAAVKGTVGRVQTMCAMAGA